MDKQFIGRVEAKQTKFGELIKISFGTKDRQLLQDTQKNGWNNLALKKGKAGNYYLEIDTYEPKEPKEPKEKQETPADDLPF